MARSCSKSRASHRTAWHSSALLPSRDLCVDGAYDLAFGTRHLEEVLGQRIQRVM